MCGSVRFQPEQICAVTDSVSEQQRSVRSISRQKFSILKILYITLSNSGWISYLVSDKIQKKTVADPGEAVANPVEAAADPDDVGKWLLSELCACLC